MKRFFKSQLFYKLASYLVRIYVYIVLKTCQFTIEFDKEAEEIVKSRRLCLMSYWHGRIIFFPSFYTKYGKFGAIVSAHGDGQIVADVIESYGHQTARGSSRKNNVSAMRDTIRLLRQNVSIHLTPDGPKGPRFKIKGGVMELAKKFDIAVIPSCFSITRGKMLNTWDRFLLPMPFAKVLINIGKPVYATGVKDNEKLQKIMIDQMVKLDEKMGLKVDYDL
ncbi:MAG: lysophospholipid acyltransferase family protein [Rickettsiales bacterium]